jgi:hypothetical protein
MKGTVPFIVAGPFTSGPRGLGERVFGDVGGMSTPEKDPQDWVTGDEPMTGPQKSYLETLARDAGEDVPGDLSKAEASEKIDELQERSDRVSG